MSFFIGPLHHKMYDRITFQNGIVNKLVSESGSSKLLSELNLKTEDFTGKTLDDLVDLSNIHGSLESMIAQVETRLAFTTAFLLNNSIMTQDEILSIVNNYGELHKIEADNLENAFDLISDKLLNGMPCDKVTETIETSDKRIIWIDAKDIHSHFWQEQNVDPNLFYEIRLSLLKGIIGSNFTIEYLGDRKFKLSDADSMQVLVNEHNNIVRMLKVLKNQTIRFMNKENIDIDFYNEFIDFSRNYADKHHHGKEEQILFRYMTKTLGPVAEKLVTHGMLVEHDMGRYYVSTLEKAVADFKETGSDEDRLTIIMAAMAYADLLQRHIDKENEVVYTFAARALTEDIMDKIESESIQFEKEYCDRKRKYESYLKELEQ